MNMGVSISAFVLHAAFKTELNESKWDLLIMERKCAEFLAHYIESRERYIDT
jgi:hypothetical protein